MEMTLIPTPLQIHEWMQEAAHDAILQICQQNQIGPAELHQIAHQLAQREAAADSLTEGKYDHFACN